MDSVSQVALGAAVGVAVMGRRTAVWKAAAWGAVCGTLPDLDSLIDYGDPIRNMTLHRAESHAFFYLTLLSPLLAWLIVKIHGETDRFRRWWPAVWLALVTHPMLDLMTIYGTQVALPFSDARRVRASSSSIRCTRCRSRSASLRRCLHATADAERAGTRPASCSAPPTSRGASVYSSTSA